MLHGTAFLPKHSVAWYDLLEGGIHWLSWTNQKHNSHSVCSR